MQTRHTYISEEMMDHYLRRGRLERSCAMYALLRAVRRAITKAFRTVTGSDKMPDKASCAS